MATDKLTPLQRPILRALAALTPPWTLTGGGALAGVHLGHRTRRDLDLFWRARPDLGSAAADAQAPLRAGGVDVVALRTAPAHAELRVADGGEVCSDLVAEPFPAVEPPVSATVGDVTIAVDSMHEIAVGAGHAGALSCLRCHDTVGHLE
jgi:hypothetical protein